MKKTLARVLVAVTIAATLAATATDASAQWRGGGWGGGWHGGWGWRGGGCCWRGPGIGAGIAAGVVGGAIVAGAILATRPAGYVVYPGYAQPLYGPNCYWASQPVVDPYGRVVGYTGQPVQICPGYVAPPPPPGYAGPPPGPVAAAGPPPGPGPDDPTAYCTQRYRSYDPASGTYLGNDGQRHPCP
ncbi:MAG: BA14K family protein [Xanthobacteraceae bacterium]|nr:BA14K family protein [Xanthobacteraceae bacterium]